MRSTKPYWIYAEVRKGTLAAGLLAAWFAVCGTMPAQDYGSRANSEAETEGTSESDWADAIYENNVAGLPWLHDKGVMFFVKKEDVRDDRSSLLEAIDGKYDKRKTLPYYKGFCLTAKLQNDFAATDEDAKPANFSWTKDAGSDAFWEADAALRFDLWLPDSLYKFAETSISFGVELDKSLAEEEIDRRTYHLGLSMAALPNNQLPLLKTADQVFQIGASYTQDELGGTDSWNWDVNWEPAFDAGLMKVGMRCGLDGKVLDPADPPDRNYYYFRPDVGLSYGEQTLLGMPIATAKDDFVASYQLRVGFGFLLGKLGTSQGRVDISYGLRGGVAGEGDDFNFQEARLSLVPDNSGPTSIDVSYLLGNDGFDAPDVDRFRIGFGIQF